MKIISLEPNSQQSLDLYEYLDALSEEAGFDSRKVKSASYLFFAEDEHGKFLGGIQGAITGEWLEIYTLYSTREVKNVGITLLRYIESYAKENKCQGIKLVTHEFQSPNFYLKYGYEIYGRVPDLIKDYDNIFMKKVL